MGLWTWGPGLVPRVEVAVGVVEDVVYRRSRSVGRGWDRMRISSRGDGARGDGGMERCLGMGWRSVPIRPGWGITRSESSAVCMIVRIRRGGCDFSGGESRAIGW